MRPEPLIHNDHDLRLRKATIQDSALVFGWRNRPEIVVLGRTQRTVEWGEHVSWFERIICSQEDLFLLIMFGDAPIGVVRFDRTCEKSSEVSIYLIPPYLGKGLGVQALRKACLLAFASLSINEIIAVVRTDNMRSLSAFQRSGFKLDLSQNSATAENNLVLRIARFSDVYHNRLTFGTAEIEAVQDTVKSGFWACGPKVDQLENTLARMAGVSHAVCVSSGVSAQRLTLLGLGIRPNDRVLVPAYSCVALANAVLAVGAVPIPVEISHGDWNIDIKATEKLLADANPRAIIAVNTFGFAAQIERLNRLGIPVIEDCAHAFGEKVEGKPLGGRGAAGLLSFYATKLIGAGEGGCVLTDSDNLAEFVRTWRDYSDKPPDGTRLNDKMTDIEASLVLCQLERLPEMLAARQRLAVRYDKLLRIDSLRTNVFRLPDISQPRVWYRYSIELMTSSSEPIVEALERYGIHATCPITDWRMDHYWECPIADNAYANIISLPLYPTLTEEEQERCVIAFLDVLSRHELAR